MTHHQATVARSPITGTTDVVQERSISTDYIIKAYKESYDIDVASLFGGAKEIHAYRCAQSGFRFYAPGSVAGDSDFYAQLQRFPWYYMDWKWEYDVVKNTLQSGDRLLEIGCAEGAFISRLDTSIESVGLELNRNAALAGQDAGLDIRTESIQDHAIINPNHYDVVCSYQVMEHVTDVRGIVAASVQALKPGGRLIISVPNNDSFIKYSPDSILNMPPHHMNLWDEASLKGLQDHFDMELVGFELEPLQPYHYPVVISNFIERRISRGFVGKVIKKLIKWTQAYRLVGLVKNSIKGHSIIATYRKTA